MRSRIIALFIISVFTLLTFVGCTDGGAVSTSYSESTAGASSMSSEGVNVTQTIDSMPEDNTEQQVYFNDYIGGCLITMSDRTEESELGESVEIAVTDAGIERICVIYNQDEDYGDAGSIKIQPFDEIMGYTGFRVIRTLGYGGIITDYFGIDGGRLIKIGSSWGNLPTEDDYIVDIDGDGKSELICNVTYLADGGQRTKIYRSEDGEILEGDTSGLLDVEYYHWGAGSTIERYDPDKNVVTIHYAPDEQSEFVSKDYEIDLDKIDFYAMPVDYNMVEDTERQD